MGPKDRHVSRKDEAFVVARERNGSKVFMLVQLGTMLKERVPRISQKKGGDWGKEKDVQ